MITPEEEESGANEAAVKKRFEKLGYVVKRLDSKSSKRPRPDFLVSRSGRPQMLCEVKTIFSGGYLPDKGFHLSTRDENLGPFTLYRKDIRLTEVDRRLSDAVRQRDALVADKPNLKKLPLLVAFFIDFYAQHLLSRYPRTFNKQVSGILAIKRDETTRKALDEITPAERERRLFDPDWERGLPTSGKVFVCEIKLPVAKSQRIFNTTVSLKAMTKSSHLLCKITAGDGGCPDPAPFSAQGRCGFGDVKALIKATTCYY